MKSPSKITKAHYKQHSIRAAAVARSRQLTFLRATRSSTVMALRFTLIRSGTTTTCEAGLRWTTTVQCNGPTAAVNEGDVR